MSEILKMSDLMDQVNSFSQSQEGQLPSVWKKVVSKIKSVDELSETEAAENKRFPLGERLAGNTRVLDLKNGILIIESDHPGWIQYLNFYEKFILKGLKMELPELNIKSLAVRLKEKRPTLADSYEQAVEKAKKELQAKMDEEDKEVKKYFEGQEKSKKAKDDKDELPPELKAKFDSLMKTVLTNSDK